MKSRLLLKVQIGALTAALCVYAGLYAYKSHRYATAFADTQLGDGSEAVTRRFGVPPNNIESPHSGYLLGFTVFPCTPPCDERLVWLDPTSVFRGQAYYFEFDVNRHLIRKTHFEHLDEAFLRSEELSKEGMKRTRDAALDWTSTDAERFRAAKVVALVRLLDPPQFNPRDYSWLSKFLVMRAWKGPFSAGATITATTVGMCYGPDCPQFPKQAGQLVVLFSLGDMQPIYPIIERYGVDEAHIEKATHQLDGLAAQTGT
jgi:hypothetical protein